MSHTRFELGFTRNRKVASLSDAAFRLWISAIDHAREQATNGLITQLDLELIPRCPKGRKLAKLLQELVDKRAFDAIDNGWQVHDFLHWQDSAEVVEDKRAAARERMRNLRTHRRTEGDGSRERSREQDGERSGEVRHGSGSGSGSGEREEISGRRSKDLTGQSSDGPPPSPRPRDRLVESFAPAHLRPDVAQVFERWREAAGQPGSKLASGDLRAQILADRIDQHGVEACLRVLSAAQRDPWHSGAKDGRRHMRVEQIFGRDSAAPFDELLAASGEAEGAGPEPTEADLEERRRAKAEREAREVARARAELEQQTDPSLDPNTARQRVQAALRGAALRRVDS